VLRAVLFLVCLSSCRLPKVERPYPPPSAEEMMTVLRERRDRLRTLRVETKVDHRGPTGDRVKLSVTMVLARGGKMRLEAESPLVGPVAVLATGGVEFRLLDSRRHRFFTGRASACNVARMTEVHIPPADVVDILMGGAPIEAEVVSTRWDPRGREVLELRASDGTETLYLDAKDRNWDIVEAERRGAHGEKLWHVRHENFTDRGNGVRFPERSTVDDLRHKTDVKVRYKDLEMNLPLPDDVFTLARPVGVDLEEVGCAD
jgi:hypothetical protein